jgi:hypothetical protein
MQDYDFSCGLYEFETWSVALEEERIQGIFEDRVLRRIFGPRRVRFSSSSSSLT